MKLLFCLLILALGLIDSKVGAAESLPSPNRILVVIGYSDGNDPQDKLGSIIGEHRFYFNTALSSETTIKEELLLNGFTKSTQHQNTYANSKTDSLVTIFNVNYLCEGENIHATVRSGLCPGQVRRSVLAREFLDKNLSQFDRFIYIGHARQSLGLALGPFVPEYTFQFSFTNSVEAGRLKKIFIGACYGLAYYKQFVSSRSGIQLKGPIEKKITWDQATKMAIAELFLP